MLKHNSTYDVRATALAIKRGDKDSPAARRAGWMMVQQMGIQPAFALCGRDSLATNLDLFRAYQDLSSALVPSRDSCARDEAVEIIRAAARRDGIVFYLPLNVG